jgi:Tfp pilus assembly protein PilN
VRPVNLIPPEERRGDKAPMRTGPLSYVVVAGLALALIAVTAIVLTGNQISDRKAEKESIDSQVAQAEAQASRLKPYADFAALQQARELTVQSLAQSRFNWQRVLREVAIVIPSDVWLTNLAAKVSPDVQTSDSGSSSTSSSSGSSDPSITGPSLDIQGCASGHDAVASFLAALHDVDGVTRVSVLKSDRPDLSASTGSSGTTTAEGCADRDFISTFEIEAAFDAAPAGAAASTTTTSVSAGTAADLSQVQDGQQELQQQKDSAAEKTAKGRKAVDTFIPGTAVAP